MKKFFERTSSERQLLGKADIFLFLILAALCIAICAPFFLKKGDVKAKIIYDGEVVEEINLSKNADNYVLNIGRCKIAVEKNEIYFKDSPCPDKVCVKTGRLSKSGQFASCVPEKVTIILKGGEKLPDAVTY